MKKLLLLFAAIMMASTGLWAETVSYLYPVYNTDGVPTSGIKEWKNGSANATVVENASEPVTWGTTGTTTWYVVSGADVTLSKGAVCQGAVRLILADGAKLTANGYDKDDICHPGIQVSGDGDSFTVYGQTAQSGQLYASSVTYLGAGIGGKGADGWTIEQYNLGAQDLQGCNITINGGTVTATGGVYGAGIGGGSFGAGSNITINGGTVTANGGDYGAGLGGGYGCAGSNITINGGTVTANGGLWAAGIGGGRDGSGSYITITGGMVKANGGADSAGIGGGKGGSGSNIFVATGYIVKAGNSGNPTTEIAASHTSTTDIANEVEPYLYVTIEPRKFAVVYGDHITVSPSFASGTEIASGTQITFTATDCSQDGYLCLGFYMEPTFDTPITTGVYGETYTVTVTDAAISVYVRRLCQQHVAYIDEKGESCEVDAYVVDDASTHSHLGMAGTTSWYVVKGTNVQLSKGAYCAGNVKLILADGAKLTATGAYEATGVPGVQVSGGGNSLTVYGQAAQSGQLIANGGPRCAGIGGGRGDSGSNITINGGTVTATGGQYGAGIGGGDGGSGYNITINGGTVAACGKSQGAGIGGGSGGSGSYITINGGTVTATCGENASCIGGGAGSSGCRDIIFSSSLSVKAGDAEDTAEVMDYYRTSSADFTEELAGKRYVTTAGRIAPEPVSVAYIDENGEEETASAVEISKNMSISASLGKENTTSWYVVTGSNVQFTQGVICIGNVNLILADGAKLTATGITNLGTSVFSAGIQVSSNGNSLTIYVQTNQSGQLFANGGGDAAGIGGGSSGAGGTVTINGGTVTANGGEFGGAGIGGGNNGAGGTVTINGGTVTANGGEAGGAGIGGGLAGAGGTVTINGGTVTANGGKFGAGIGSGRTYAGGTVTINGGTVTANGGEFGGAGIGGGLAGAGGTVTISGGKVTAQGNNASDIGPGANKTEGTVSISGGLLWRQPDEAWLAPDCIVTENPDEATKEAYPYRVWPPFVVTVGTLPHLTVTWTSGDGSVTHTVEDGAFRVKPGTENVKVMFTANPGYMLVHGPVVVEELGTVTKDIKFGSGGDYKVPTSTLAPVKYVDADGVVREKANGEFTKVSSSTKKLAKGKWYAVIDDVTLTSSLTVEETAHLILCDWASLTVNVKADDKTAAISVGSGASLTIYGQTANTGSLDVKGGVSAAGIGGGNGGACGAITICGGTVTAQGGNYGAGIGNGLLGQGGSVTIKGGSVTANGGASADGIGNGYSGSGSTVIIATTLVVKAGTKKNPTTVLTNDGANLASSLAGKQFVTVAPITCEITANQDPDDTKHYYSTFYSSEYAYKVPEGMTAYTGVANGNVLKLTPTANGIIPAGEAVILRLTTDDNTDMTKVSELTATTTTATKSDDNMLQGSDEEKTLPLNSYALSLGQNGVGFYKFDGKTLPAHKAYLTHAAGSAISLRFSFGDATDIDTIETEAPAKAYNLQGQQVDENYKGIVIKNGKKVLNN